MTQRSSYGAVPSRWQLLAAFAAIYLIWGSTYVAIRFAVETVPPFFLGAVRFTIAGLIMFAWARAKGAPAPSPRNWKATVVAGFMLFVLNNGGLVWASQYVPSGMAALLIGATPMWMVLLDWWRPTVHGRQPGGVRPTTAVFVGLLVGFFGILLLVNPTGLADTGHEYAVGVIVILLASIAWAAGSIYSRQSDQPASPILSTGMQLLSGGLMLLAVSAGAGEIASLDVSAITLRSAVSWLYLAIFGSIIGFGSYVWLLRVTTTARVATYAYVNPIVAVFLGWALASEPVTPRTIIAAAIIISAVMMINSARTRVPVPRKPQFATGENSI